MIRAFVILVAAVLCQLPSVSPAKAQVLEWTMRNDHVYTVYVKFFSMNRRGHEWPGNGNTYVYSDGYPKTVRLSCRSGEKICFGGFTSSRQTWWGVGEFGNKGCQSCCRTCGEYYSATDVLN
ncbi:MAG: hypothetical protein AAF393_07195 [Pseudomonadota bacterium]